MTSTPSTRGAWPQDRMTRAWGILTRTRAALSAGFLATAALALLTLSACSRPTPPDTEKRPEPQADAGRLPRTIQAPLEKARDVEADLEQAAEVRRAAIEAAGG